VALIVTLWFPVSGGLLVETRILCGVPEIVTKLGPVITVYVNETGASLGVELIAGTS
jgi:hypothetical protein